MVEELSGGSNPPGGLNSVHTELPLTVQIAIALIAINRFNSCYRFPSSNFARWFVKIRITSMSLRKIGIAISLAALLFGGPALEASASFEVAANSQRQPLSHRGSGRIYDRVIS